jgi:hypothetical protein
MGTGGRGLFAKSSPPQPAAAESAAIATAKLAPLRAPIELGP